VRAGVRAIVVAVAVLLASRAAAHEVLHSVERGRAVAVRAFYPDGEPLAYAEYQVFSPVDAKIPYQKGRTDRSGYLAFVPERPGQWHVRVAEASGHGLDLDVSVEGEGQPRKTEAPASAGVASWVVVLRPVLGVVLIGGLFVGLLAFYRKKGSRS
jgi:nickel transport protein